MNTMDYRVKLEQFEGPLDLLLNLIEEQKLDITTVSLATVTDQYLEYIQNKEHISLLNIAEFLDVATKLILIKSKALLPLLELDEQEEEEIKDLAWQLQEFKKFRDVASIIGAMTAGDHYSATRPGFVGMSVAYAPPEGITMHDLKSYFSQALSLIPLIEKLEERIISDVVTLEEKIEQVQKMVRSRAITTFSEMTGNTNDRMDVVVSFLALLELVKQRVVSVEQEDLFADIHLTHAHNMSHTQL